MLLSIILGNPKNSILIHSLFKILFQIIITVKNFLNFQMEVDAIMKLQQRKEWYENILRIVYYDGYKNIESMALE